MASDGKIRVRRSIEEIQDDYRKPGGDKTPLLKLMKAWQGIKALKPDDPHSFFRLGGYHGEPFRGAGWGTSSYWGGYCNHGNVLFPVWHRVYLLKLEEALQSIGGCEDVMLPFWDEASDRSRNEGIPWALTVETFDLEDGHGPVANPLRSFVFNQTIQDNISGDNPNYSKPKGYETKRYPLSGLVGSAAEREATKAHNDKYPNYETNVGLLNGNIVAWLGSHIVVDGKNVATNVYEKFVHCLNAPNYTVFSNTTSAAQWNSLLDKGVPPVTPLESPHNDIHLAVGGFDAPGFDASPISGANGDMGENDTAGLDPIFFFHHCFIDRVFWLWQKRHGATDRLELIEKYPGTNSVDNQGPTPGVVPNSWLTLSSPLDPFTMTDGDGYRTYTALDCINIEEQLGYTYGKGSLEESPADVSMAATDGQLQVVHVSGIDRAQIAGSFLVSTFVTIDGKRIAVGTHSVLSRWHVEGCANCQTHLRVRAAFPLHGLARGAVAADAVEVEVRTRKGVLGGAPKRLAAAAAATGAGPAFHVELR